MSTGGSLLSQGSAFLSRHLDRPEGSEAFPMGYPITSMARKGTMEFMHVNMHEYMYYMMFLIVLHIIALKMNKRR